jgi:uncharacterized protein YbjT (DUF2867 family)
MIVVLGATGNIGQKLVELLLMKRQKVRAIARTKERLQHLQLRGAEVMQGDLSDTAFLTGALQGATAVFAMIPPNMGAQELLAAQNAVGESIAKAIEAAGVKHVVNLSSVGAHLPEGGGIVQPLYFQEQRLNQIPGLNVVHLRAAYFMENLFGSLGIIKHMNINGSPLSADLKFGLIATQDIAHVAANILASASFTGQSVQFLLGAGDLTMKEVTEKLGKALGKPELPYVQFPYEEAEATMTRMGFTPSVAHAMVEFQQSFNEGRVQEGATRTPATTTPTELEAFIPTLVRAFNVLQ